MRKAAYTFIIGDYDTPSPPAVLTPGWDYICFTDNQGLKSDIWQLRISVRQDADGELDNKKFAMKHMILFHKYLADYDLSLSLGGQLQVNCNLDDWLGEYLQPDDDMLIARHPERDSIYDEAEVCKRDCLDDPQVIEAQMQRYRAEGYPRHHGLFTTGFILRRHDRANLQGMCELWYEEYLRGSRRDQLSLNYAIWKSAPLRVKALDYAEQYQSRRHFILHEHKRPLSRIWQPANARFNDGTPVPPIVTMLYYSADHFADTWPDPYDTQPANSFFAWLNAPADADPLQSAAPVVSNLAFHIYQTRIDLKEGFPDPFVRQREAFVKWFLAYAQREYELPDTFLEAARASLRDAGRHAETRMTIELNPIFREDYNLNALHQVDVGGFEMLVTPRYLDEYVTNPYEPYSSEIVRQLLPPHGTFLDVGAHYGYFGLLAAQVQPTAHVIAVEPVKANFLVLERNFDLNRISSRELHNVAASDKTETRLFRLAAASNNASFYPHPNAPTKEMVPVAAVALDEIVGQRRIDLIKMDIEGHEIPALNGLRHTLEQNRDVPLLIEFNAKMQRAAGYDPSELLKTLLAFDFEIFEIDEGARTLARITHKTFKWRELSSREHSLNLLCLRGNVQQSLARLGYPSLFEQGRLKVCFFAHTPSLAGGELSLLGRVDKLASDCEIESVVILPAEGVLAEKLRAVGAATEIVPYQWWCGAPNGEPKDFDAMVSAELDRILEQAHQVIAKYQPDVIASCTLTIPWGAFAAASEDLPHIWFVGEFGVLDHGFTFYLPFQNALQTILRLSNRVLPGCEKIQEILFPDGDPGRVQMLLPPILIPDTLELHDPPPPDPLEILLLGSVLPTKGQLDAVLAVDELVRRGRRVHLNVVGVTGDPEYFARLQQTVQEKNLESCVTFHGFTEDRFKFVLNAHVCLSCSRMEAFGRTVAEAAMLARPVIVTEGSGTVASIIPGKSGLTYRYGDQVELADRIEFFINNPDQVLRFGAAGREHILRRVSHDATIGKLGRLLNEVQRERNPVGNVLLPHLLARTRREGEQRAALQEQLSAQETAVEDLRQELVTAQSRLQIQDQALAAGQSEIDSLRNLVSIIQAGKVRRAASLYWRARDRTRAAFRQTLGYAHPMRIWKRIRDS